MISLPKKLFYAIEAVLFIAYNAGGAPLSGRDIAARQGLPPRYLEQLLQRLVRGGILRGVRGPHGGYVLAREKRRLSVADICGALEGEDMPEYQGTKLASQVVWPLWQRAHGKLMEHLKDITLAELCDEALAKHIRKEAQDKTDFTI